MATEAMNAAANRPGWKRFSPNATADPTSTGVIEAVKEKGRTARHQSLNQPGLGPRAWGLAELTGAGILASRRSRRDCGTASFLLRPPRHGAALQPVQGDRCQPSQHRSDQQAGKHHVDREDLVRPPDEKTDSGIRTRSSRST